MGGIDVWGAIHDERAALASDLQRLTEAQWATPSLCAQWTVQQVLGHMTATAKMTTPRFLALWTKSGLRFERMVAREVARETSGPGAETLAGFTSVLNATTHPPGPVLAMVGEAVLHSEDIRRPLGIKREYPTEPVVAVADFYKGSNLVVGAKRRIEGLRLTATDAEWSHGSGKEVSGPILSLAMAMTGRRAALDDLSGEGVQTLASRA
jgi:uncharacterized protein (TIGR03083 family)